MLNFLIKKIKIYKEGSILLGIGITVYLVVIGNPWRDYQLMTNAVTCKGVATEVSDFEERQDNGNLTRSHFIEYQFVTPSGEKFSNVVERSGKSSDAGYWTGQTLEIDYLPGDPGVNRIKSFGSESLSEFMIKHLFFLLLAIAPGVYFIVKAYRAARKFQKAKVVNV